MARYLPTDQLIVVGLPIMALSVHTIFFLSHAVIQERKHLADVNTDRAVGFCLFE